MKTVDTITHRGYTINVYPDSDPYDPRAEWDNLGTMVCFHKRHTLGDKTDYQSDQFNSWGELRAELAKRAAIILPLYMYDHSGITISTSPFSCLWDSGQIGYIYVDKETLRKEYSVRRISAKTLRLAKRVLLSEVTTYNQYLRGEVYGYTIDGLDESCWGFYGDPKEHMIPECKSLIDSHIAHERKKHFKQLKAWIANHVTLDTRVPLANNLTC